MIYDLTAQCGQPAFELGDGDGKADVAHGPAATGLLDPGRVDADDLAVAVHERTSAAARVCGRVGLKQLDTVLGSCG